MSKWVSAVLLVVLLVALLSLAQSAAVAKEAAVAKRAPAAGAPAAGRPETGTCKAAATPRGEDVNAPDVNAPDVHGPAGREFLFKYGAEIKGLAPGTRARVWLPVPPTDGDQEVATVRQDVPGDAKVGAEPKYGNRVLYAEPAAGPEGRIKLSVTYRVKRREVKGESRARADDAARPAEGAAEAEQALFLKADAKVPVGPDVKPMKLVRDKPLPDDAMTRARLFYDVVNTHMVYGKDRPGWGHGDAEWACDSRFGNCSDFHSLFISLARSHRIPAKFEMGFPIPAARGKGEVGGYHCWAMFKPGGAVRGWVPVDISEANKTPSMRDYYFGNLTADRVSFTVGRDITLVPKQDGPPLNFFIYPYVEVDGKPLPAEQVERKFSYEDLPAGAGAGG